MPNREPFLLRLSSDVLAAVKKLAHEQSRSANGQIEFMIKQLLIQAGRWEKNEGAQRASVQEEE